MKTAPESAARMSPAVTANPSATPCPGASPEGQVSV